MSMPLLGGGPEKPPAIGEWRLSKPGVGGTPGEAIGFPKADRPGDVNGWLLYTVPTGDIGVSFILSGVGPFGNSHCVD